MEKKFNGQTYEATYHARLRYNMRADSTGRISKKILKESIPVTLSGGYNRGFLNREKEVVFLVSGHDIATVIDASELELSDSDLVECGECSARIQKTCERLQCRFCGTEYCEDKEVLIESEEVETLP